MSSDQARFEYYMTGQLAKFDLGGRMSPIGKPAMIANIDPAPKGDVFRVSTIQKPFSYLVPASSFGRKEEIWDQAGKALTTLDTSPLRPGEPPTDPNATPTPPTPAARRQLGWMPDGSGLYFIRTKAKPTSTPPSPILAPGEDEQARGQRPGGTAPTAPREPEELVKWVAPFRKEDESVLLTRESGFSGLTWNPDASAIFITDTKDGETSFKQIPLGKDPSEVTLWSYKGTAENPGSPVLTTNALGVSVLDAKAPPSCSVE